jgi:hypothetical protein
MEKFICAGISILALLTQACDSTSASAPPATTGYPQADCVNGALADSTFSTAFSSTATGASSAINEAEQLCAGAANASSALSCFHAGYSATYPNGYSTSSSQQTPNFIVTLCSGATSTAPASCYAAAIADSTFTSTAQNDAGLISSEASGLCRQATNASAPLACFHSVVSDSVFSSNLSLIGNPESLCNQATDSVSALSCFHAAMSDSVFSGSSFTFSSTVSNPAYAMAANFCGGSLQSLYSGFVNSYNPANPASSGCSYE